MSNIIVVAVINPTGFTEVYPNRISEDIYDSLEQYQNFVFQSNGPTFNS